jgi:hypothetical protein
LPLFLVVKNQQKKMVMGMINDEYELMPQKALEGMKKELEELRKHTSNIEPKTGLPKETATSIDKLSGSINQLMDLFKKASDELKLEENEEKLLGKQIQPLIEKIDMLLDQNKKIAKGIVAIADMIKEQLPQMEKKLEEEETYWKKQKEEPKPAPRQSFGMPQPPSFGPGSQFGPGPMMPPPPGMQQEMQEPFPPMGGQMPGMPEMPQAPAPGASWPDFPPGPMPGLDDRPKKAGLFGGMFKK